MINVVFVLVCLLIKFVILCFVCLSWFGGILVFFIELLIFKIIIKGVVFEISGLVICDYVGLEVLSIRRLSIMVILLIGVILCWFDLLMVRVVVRCGVILMGKVVLCVVCC